MPLQASAYRCVLRGHVYGCLASCGVGVLQVCGATGLVSPRAQPQEQARTAHYQVCLSPPCHVAHYRLPQHAFLRCTYPLTIASAVAIELAKHGVFFFFFFGLVRTSWFGGVTVMRSVRCRTWLWFRYPLGAKCFTATCTRLTLHMHARPHMPNNGCRCALAHRAAQQRGGVLQAVELFLPRRKEPAGPPRGTHGGWADESWRPYVSFSGPYTDIVIFIVFCGCIVHRTVFCHDGDGILTYDWGRTADVLPLLPRFLCVWSEVCYPGGYLSLPQ